MHITSLEIYLYHLNAYVGAADEGVFSETSRITTNYMTLARTQQFYLVSPQIFQKF